MVNLLSHGTVVRMGKRSRQHRHPPRPGRGDRRRRRALRAGAQLPRDQPRHRPRPLDQGDERQPGLLRPVRPRADQLASSATPPTSGFGRRRDSHPELLTHEKEGELLRALAEFPRVVAGRGRPPRAAPDRALPRGDRGVLPPVLRQAAGCSRWATRSRPTCTGPGCCWSTPPAPCSPTVLPSSASPPRSGCEPPMTHEAGLGARAAAPSGRRPGCASPATPTPWSATSGRRPRTRRTASSASAASG